MSHGVFSKRLKKTSVWLIVPTPLLHGDNKAPLLQLGHSGKCAGNTWYEVSKKITEKSIFWMHLHAIHCMPFRMGAVDNPITLLHPFQLQFPFSFITISEAAAKLPRHPQCYLVHRKSAGSALRKGADSNDVKWIPIFYINISQLLCSFLTDFTVLEKESLFWIIFFLIGLCIVPLCTKFFV